MDAYMGCIQGLVGTWASMTPLNAARPRAVPMSLGVEGTEGEKPTGVSKKSAEREKGSDGSQSDSSSRSPARAVSVAKLRAPIPASSI